MQSFVVLLACERDDQSMRKNFLEWAQGPLLFLTMGYFQWQWAITLSQWAEHLQILERSMLMCY